jgi:hypothetical protein
VPVRVPVKICAGAKLTAINTINAKKKAENRPVKVLVLLQWNIVVPLRIFPNYQSILIGYSRIAAASRAYSSKSIKIIALSTDGC